MKISNNYTLDEFKRSATATLRGIDNTIPSFAVNNIRILVKHLLQPINDATGWKNLISSGYRNEKLNALVGGSKTSMHMTGEASDNKFYIDDSEGITYLAPIDVAKKVIELKLDFDQMILYPTFLHLSYTTKKRGNRKQVLYNKNYRGSKL